MKTYPFLRYIPDENIQRALDAEYTPNAYEDFDGRIYPKDRCGRCFLGVAIPDAGPTPRAAHVIRMMHSLGWIGTVARDVLLAGNEAAGFIDDFDAGLLLGDTLRQVVEASRA